MISQYQHKKSLIRIGSCPSDLSILRYDLRYRNHLWFQMGSRLMASRIQLIGRGMSQPTPFGKRMDRLQSRIFNEVYGSRQLSIEKWLSKLTVLISQVVLPTDTRSHKVVRVMSAEPVETKEQLSPKYYPNLPMFHYLTKVFEKRHPSTHSAHFD